MTDEAALIFCENAWISSGTPWYKPVYACYSAGMNELASEELLDIIWIDGRYDEQKGILTTAVCTQRNQNFGDALDNKTFLFILTGDALIMKKTVLMEIGEGRGGRDEQCIFECACKGTIACEKYFLENG